MTQALLFDLDGTLLDQEGAERAALEKFYWEAIKIEPMPSFHAFLREWRNSAEEWLTQYLAGKISFDEQRSNRLMDVHHKFGVEIAKDRAAELHHQYMDYYSREWRAFGDAEPLLKALKGKVRLGVVTNGDGKMQRAKMAQTGLVPYFESIIVSGEAGVAKPSKAIFDKAADSMKLAPAELAYVGDRFETDAVGAKKAGWRSFWLNRLSMPGQPDEGIETISSLSELLEKFR